MATPVPDRRKTPRVPTPGVVEIAIQNPLETAFQAKLVDTSPHGFRILHESKELVPGMEVRFRGDSGAGRARIIWTHIRGSHRESGLLLL